MSDQRAKEQFRRAAQVAAAVSNPATATAVVAAGATPTKAEYDQLRLDHLNTRAALTALLTSLRNAGLLS